MTEVTVCSRSISHDCDILSIWLEWVVVTERWRESLTSLHCLHSTPCVYSTTTEEREGGDREPSTIPTTQAAPLNCFCFVLSWLTFIIYYPAGLDNIMKWSALWNEICSPRREREAAQRSKHNVATVKVSCLIAQLPVKQITEKRTHPNGCKPAAPANLGGGRCDIFLTAYLHKGHEPPRHQVKCLFRSLSSKGKTNKMAISQEFQQKLDLYSKPLPHTPQALRLKYFL